MSFGLRALPAIRHLFTLVTLFFLNISARLIIAPLMPVARADLGIGHADSGLLFLLLALGYGISLIASSGVAARLTHRWIIRLSSMATGMALLLVSMSDSFLHIQLGVLIIGLATGLYLPSGMAVITAVIRRSDWGKAIAIHELAPNLGSVVVPLAAEALLAHLRWRGVLAVLGTLCLVASLTAGQIDPLPSTRSQTSLLGSLRDLLRQPAFWMLALLFGFASGANFGVYAMLPLYLTSAVGLERAWANSLVALSRIPGVVTGLAAGVLADRLGVTRTMRLLLAGAGLSTILLGLETGAWLPMIVLLQATLATSFFPPAFAILSSLGPPHRRNLAVSIVVPIAIFVGNGAIPSALGLLGDWGRFPLGMALLGGLLVSSAVYFRHLPEPVEA